jgi:hypothetical protein
MRLASILVLVLAANAHADTTKIRPAPAQKAPPPANNGRQYRPSTTPRPEPPPRAQPTHPEGEYGGVTPGQKPDPRNQPRPAKGALSWIGFEAKNGGAELFFQSAAQFEVSQRVEGNTLVVHLGLTHLGKNTWRQIDTRYFDNPLSGVVARYVGANRGGKNPHGAGIQVRITFKNAKEAREATMRTNTEADGLYYVYLTFPEGAEAPSKSDPEK